MAVEPAVWIRDDDEPPRKAPPPANDSGMPLDGGDRPEAVLLRCFPCAGSGRIVLFGAAGREGRPVRCPVCRGRGRVALC